MKYHDRLYNELYRRAITEPNNYGMRDNLVEQMIASDKRLKARDDYDYLRDINNYKRQQETPYNKKKCYKDYFNRKSLYPNGVVYDYDKGQYIKPYKHPHIDNCGHCEYAKKALKYNRRVKYSNNLRYKQLEI